MAHNGILGLPPGIAGYAAAQELGRRRQASELGQLQGILSMQNEMAMQPYRMEALQGQAAEREAMGRYREAQMAELQRRGVLAQRQEQAQGVLANLLATGGYQGEVAGPTNVAMNEADALKQVQEAEARGQQLGVNVPNPGNVQALSVMADPQRAIPELLRQQRPPGPPRGQIIPAAGGYVDMTSGTPQYVRTAPEAQPAPRRDPLVRVMGVDGKPILRRESEAEGMTPAPNPSGREDNETVRRVLQFGQAMEKAGFAETYANLDTAMKLAKPEVLPYLTGPGSLVPDPLLNKEITDGRQALQRILNITLKDRSGAAVTVPEWERFKKEAGVGILKKPDQIPTWLTQAKTILDKHYQGVAASYPEEVRNRYFEELGRVAPFGSAAAPRGAPAVGTVQGGYRFKGGDPSKPENWERQ